MFKAEGMTKFMQKKPDWILLTSSNSPASIENHYVLSSFGILSNSPLFDHSYRSTRQLLDQHNLDGELA